MPAPASSPTEFQPGDYYEDCAFHPCVCIGVDEKGDEILGISLVDGTYPRSCSPRHCGMRKLTYEEAVHWRFFGPRDKTIRAANRWWDEKSNDEWLERFRL